MYGRESDSLASSTVFLSLTRLPRNAGTAESGQARGILLLLREVFKKDVAFVAAEDDIEVAVAVDVGDVAVADLLPRDRDKVVVDGEVPLAVTGDRTDNAPLPNGSIVVSWKRMLAYITGSVDQELMLRNEYLVKENRILCGQVKGRLRLNDDERITLAEIGKRLGRKALAEVAHIVTPETILAWHRRLIARKFDGSKNRRSPGRPRTTKEIERMVVRLAKENPSWGYDRIVGALGNLGIDIADQTVGNILQRHGIVPAPDRKKETTWTEFIRSHMNVLCATDFFTAEVWTMMGLVTYYILFFIHLGSRKVHIAGITPRPNQEWMKQIARNVTMTDVGFLNGCRYLIHDRDAKYCNAFDDILKSAGVRPVKLPPHSPNLNAFAERFVRSVKEECLDKMILFGERSLRHVLDEYTAHYHEERNHQGVGNAIPFPAARDRVGERSGTIRCRERLGGLLNFYHRKAG